ncbi:MAG: hypothetical protein CTY21_11705 [Methylomonas sp.]|nr:MAG: hypothetical protein CTY21_11705 [Methylomonas sp.]
MSIFSLEDSYNGGGIFGLNQSWTLPLIFALGLDRAAVSGIGGTGYSSRGTGPFLIAEERLAAYYNDKGAPNIIVNCNGLNDQGRTGAVSDIKSYYRYASSIAPDALHISCGAVLPQANQYAPQPGYQVVTDAIEDNISAFKNHIFVNPLNGSITANGEKIVDNSTIQISNNNHPSAMFTGSDFSGSGTANGNTSLYMGSDRTHPTVVNTGAASAQLSSGRAYIGNYLFEAVSRAIFSGAMD